MDPSPDPIVFVVQTLVSVLFAVVPAAHRHYVEAFVLALVAAQIVVSLIVARLPLAAAQHPRWGTLVRAMHRVGHMRFRDELGTLKAPGAPAREPTAAADAVRRVVEALRNEPGVAVTINTATPPRPSDAAPAEPVETHADPPPASDVPPPGDAAPDAAPHAAEAAPRDSAAFVRDYATTPAPETSPDR